MNKWLYIAVEVALREIDAKLLLALEAANKGYNVLLGSSRNIDKIYYTLPKGILFFKDCAIYNKDKFKKMKKYGHKIAILDEEAFIPLDKESFISHRVKGDVLKEIDLYFCWGENHKRLVEPIIKEINPNVKISITGHPRMDLLKKDFRKIEKGTNLILINTMFGSYNYKFGKHNYIKNLKRLGVITNKEKEIYFTNLIFYEENLFKEYVNLLKKLSQEFKNYHFMIRPHPTENIDTWKNIFKNYKNIEVKQENTVNYWIEKSMLVIHTNCTTGIETFLMDKIPISFLPIENQTYKINLPNELSLIAKKFDDIAYYISLYEKDKLEEIFDRKNKQKVLKHYLANIDFFAYKKIIDEIEKISIPNQDYNSIHYLKLNFLKFIKFFKKKHINTKFNINKNQLINKLQRFNTKFNLNEFEIDNFYNEIFLIRKK